MNDQEMLAQMQKSWPETEDYLRRVGQVTNDLMVLRELSQRDEYEASLTWLDHLAMEATDLTRRPDAVTVLWFLYRDGREVQSAMQVPAFQEIQEEYQAEQNEISEGNAGWVTVLDEGPFNLPDSDDQALWALPELQEKLLVWATETATRHDWQGQALTLAQASILLNVVLVLDSEPEQSPGWAAECLRSALSSEFFEKAGSLPR